MISEKPESGKSIYMDFNTLIYPATLAPSGHNTQPWKFSHSANVIRILPDLERRLPVVDPDDHALYISLGCALENLIIAGSREGYDSRIEYFPTDEIRECIRIQFQEHEPPEEAELFDSIFTRQSNRSRYNGKAIPDDHIAQLVNVTVSDSIEVRLIRTTEPEIEPIIRFVAEANIAQFSDREFMNELLSWIRFSKHEIQSKRDGLTANVMGFPNIPRWLGTLILKLFAKPKSEAKKSERMIRSSSALLLFIADGNDKRHWIELGRSFQRIVLTATKLGIAHAHMNMPVEVVAVREKLAKYLGITDKYPLLLIRLGYAPDVPRSPRRTLEDVVNNRNMWFI
jgi:nitroreductase